MVRMEEGRVLYLYTEFEAFKNYKGPKIWKLGHVTPVMPTYGSFYVPYAGRLRPLCLYRYQN